MTDLVSLARTLAGWPDATAQALTPDASARSYVRLINGSNRVIVMHDPTAQTARFAQIARHLRMIGLSAPEILGNSNDGTGLVLEDLGDDLFGRVLEDASQEPRLADLAADVIVALAIAPAPSTLAAPSPADWAAQIAPAFDYCAAQDRTASQAAQNTLIAAVEANLTAAILPRTALVLRDFHSENLIDLPDRNGVAAVGLLDFQDALIGSPAYDLASYVSDVRREVPNATTVRMIARVANGLGVDAQDLSADVARWTVQRNLRILGIFTRLAKDRGKSGYLILLPRVWRGLNAALQNPATASLAPVIHATVPAPGARDD